MVNRKNDIWNRLPYWSSQAQPRGDCLVASLAWRFRWQHEWAAKKREKSLLPPQSPRGFSALACLYYFASPTKTAMLRRLIVWQIIKPLEFPVKSDTITQMYIDALIKGRQTTREVNVSGVFFFPLFPERKKKRPVAGYFFRKFVFFVDHRKICLFYFSMIRCSL